MKLYFCLLLKIELFSLVTFFFLSQIRTPIWKTCRLRKNLVKKSTEKYIKVSLGFWRRLIFAARKSYYPSLTKIIRKKPVIIFHLIWRSVIFKSCEKRFQTRSYHKITLLKDVNIFFIKFGKFSFATFGKATFSSQFKRRKKSHLSWINMVSSRNNHRNGHVLVGNHQTQMESGDNDAAINKCECFFLLQSLMKWFQIYLLFKTCLFTVLF